MSIITGYWGTKLLSGLSLAGHGDGGREVSDEGRQKENLKIFFEFLDEEMINSDHFCDKYDISLDSHSLEWKFPFIFLFFFH